VTIEVPPPPWFIDPATGSVLLRLVPVHLERLHGPHPDDAQWVEAVPGQRLPFPLLAGGVPTDIVLGPGTTPADVADLPFEGRSTDFDGRRWVSLSAAARTAFGWDPHPTMHFRIHADRPVEEMRMDIVVVHCRGRSSDESFDVMDEWLRRELGPPATSAGDKKRRRYHRARTWTFPWGTVRLSYESRDREAEIQVFRHTSMTQ
jgi:hypothetical protein